jgi:hypothetical protein
MSKQNKVNPGSYTQAGRLSQDDVAREMKKQREAAAPVEHYDDTPPHHPRDTRAVTDEDNHEGQERTDNDEEHEATDVQEE